MKLVVIGGTGLIGSKVVESLRRAGHEAVAASPNTGVDTLTGRGLPQALAGASVVIDVSNSPSFEDEAVMRFFETSTRNLLAAEQAARVGHHVALSVVGAERLPESGYFRAKRAQEQLIQASSVPYTIVHATQFFEFLKSIAAIATEEGTVRLPPVLVQPIAADDVAQAVARAAMAEPANGNVEIAGPERASLDAFVRKGLEAKSDPRTVVADSSAHYYGAAVGERTLVPAGEAWLGAIRFEDWLGQAATP